jgi:uncharacterized membrane protein HdeD (DUF308 family)
METTILLSKVLGLFITIVGVVVMVRKEYFIPLISVFVKERFTRLVMSIVELMAGLFLVVTHNDFSSGPAAIITLFGYVAVIEGILYLITPDKTLQTLISKFNNPKIYLFGGLASVVVGLYLANAGFGWF